MTAIVAERALPTATPRDARARMRRLLRSRWKGVLGAALLTSGATAAALAGPALVGIVVDAVANGRADAARIVDRAAIGYALLFGGRSLAERGDCERRTLDVSGDGTNNDGIAPELARREDALAGITINGLVIGANVATLGRYYQQFVIQGQGAFVEVAQDYDGFERAMRRKLLRELGVIEMSAAPSRPLPPPAPTRR